MLIVILRTLIQIGLLGLLMYLGLRWAKSRRPRSRPDRRPVAPMLRESPHFRLARGVEVGSLDGVHEGYMARLTDEDYTLLTVNVSAERLDEVILALAAEVREPGFLIVELPASADVERRLRKTDRDPYHRDVFYLDGMTYAHFITLFRRYADLLVHDGVIGFGYGAPDAHDEVFVGRYKIVYVYADDPEKYVRVLDGLGYVEEPELCTVWDTFTPQTPGRVFPIRTGGLGVYEMVEALKKDGLHFVERREE
jgi:hypothetical protein